ncbi:hypothetical protein [Mycolicibacterium thermoresistibile]|uniref:HK97 gp10 family phage protein n=2 Tax=Mycolicibacterium thermoresistibile TaxID=1797 RepID=G7CF64_MYCT3|nr:hypothetical protein [Mycolicibacterium thermoresistibile]EHI13143.1 hypothetical protein KEK_08177 [Mycolicibacterium thermoresistibile ATCC 19527]MCV7187046.1 hypothetical protein [Mycolicibacterium thermoresistibile]GAT16298.1 putative uncharacterized protein [Mycolicibacterium thermoresistibile]SNW20332.1 Uncharacterised protein [Mycolicibacterium thermoresistibile]
MATVRVTFRLDEAALDSEVESIGRRRLASLQRRIATQARADVPVLTGHLGRSIRELPIKVSGPRVVTGGVEATADYAAPVHEGSAAHVIRPRKAKALRFQIGGRTVFARMVRHPGTKARPFLRNAAQRIASQER